MDTQNATSTEIEAEINALNSSASEPVKEVVAEVKSEPVVEQTKEEEQQPTSESPVVETKPEPVTQPSELDALMKEKGIVNPDEIAKSYKEAQKKITQLAQENAELKKSQSAPAQANPQPETIDYETINQNFVSELADNPVMAIAKIVKAITQEEVKPFHESRKDQLMQQEIIRLSTSPDTAQTFNLKNVQDEMKLIVQEDPKYLDNLSGNLSTIHDLALGRLTRRGFTINAPRTNVVSKPPLPEMARSKAPVQPVVDTKKMTASELEALINKM